MIAGGIVSTAYAQYETLVKKNGSDSGEQNKARISSVEDLEKAFPRDANLSSSDEELKKLTLNALMLKIKSTENKARESGLTREESEKYSSEIRKLKIKYMAIQMT